MAWSAFNQPRAGGTGNTGTRGLGDGGTGEQGAAYGADARLRALRAQLNPHFLFNTLNAISVLALKGEQESVVHTLSRLSDLLRLSLDEGLGQEVPLSKDLEIMDMYLDIQRVRFADRLTVRREIDDEVLDALVPSMIMQPLVENAVVHGISMRPGPGLVELRASRHDGRVRLEVRDSGPGFQGASAASAAREIDAHAGRDAGATGRDAGATGPAGDRTDADPRRRRSSGNGIGLANTRARLEQLYGGNFTFECQDASAGGATVILSIPYRRNAEPPEVVLSGAGVPAGDSGAT